METKERTVETIRQEFMQLCADAGNLAYVIKCQESDLMQKYQKMSELNREAAELDKKGKENAA